MDDLRRGDLATVAVAGDFSKPRPALVIQSDQFDTTATVTVLLVSSTLVEAPLIRLTVEPSASNGLRERSQVMMELLQNPRHLLHDAPSMWHAMPYGIQAQGVAAVLGIR